jgi:hypothetical protein
MSLTQPMDRIGFVELELEAYKQHVERLKLQRVETWKRDHEELAQRCWPLEDVISKANYVYKCNERLAEDLAKFPRSEMAQRTYVQSFYLMRSWLDLSRVLEGWAEALEREYGTIDGATDLSLHIATMDTHLHAPRPITIDSAGNAYELSGARPVLPGLEPDRIRRGIEDADAGRVRSLKDIIAARAGT